MNNDVLLRSETVTVRLYRGAAKALIILCLLGSAALPLRSWATFPDNNLEKSLMFTVVSPDMVDFFNEIAGPDDIATIPSTHAHLLPRITQGQKRLDFTSWEEGERALAASSVDAEIVGYSPEHWARTPAAEQSDLVTVTHLAAELAHSKGAQFMFAPDQRFAEEYLIDLAPDIDFVLLQGQRLQEQPEIYGQWNDQMIRGVREVNPDVKIFVQLAAHRGTAAELMTALQAIEEPFEGISVWTTPQSLETLRSFVTLLRTAEQPVNLTSPTLNTPTPLNVSPSPTVAPSLSVEVQPGTTLSQTTQSGCAAVSALPITFPVQSTEVAEYFNEVALPEDIAAFPELYFELIPQVTAGRKMAIFRSWADAESKLGELHDQIDFVGYNPEHWEHTPADEQEDLISTIKHASETAHSYGIKLMFAPDRRFASDYLVEAAPYIDAVTLQGQRLQKDPEIFQEWAQELIEQARLVNPELEIYVQVGATQGPADEMATAIRTVSDDIDGIAVWSMPRTLQVLQDFVPQGRQMPSSRAIVVSSTCAPTPTPTPQPTCEHSATTQTLPSTSSTVTPTGDIAPNKKSE